jgi:uncharacterized protein with PQ loop repeat
MFREIIGYLALIILLICNIPQVVKSLKTHVFDGLSILSIVLKLTGFIFLLIYILLDDKLQLPLLLNYVLNSLGLIIILYLYWLQRCKH